MFFGNYTYEMKYVKHNTNKSELFIALRNGYNTNFSII